MLELKTKRQCFARKNIQHRESAKSMPRVKTVTNRSRQGSELTCKKPLKQPESHVTAREGSLVVQQLMERLLSNKKAIDGTHSRGLSDAGTFNFRSPRM